MLTKCPSRCCCAHSTAAVSAGALLLMLAGAPAAGQTILSGTINWRDGAGGLHAARRVPVEVWTSHMFGADTRQATLRTDRAGGYATDLGLLWLNPGVTGSYLKIRGENPAAYIGTSFSRADMYTAYTPKAARLGLGNNFINVNMQNTDDLGRSFGVLDGMLTGWDFWRDTVPARTRVGSVRFPGTGTFYTAGTTELSILRGDAFDWDPSIHEYGHFATFADNVAVSQPGGHSSGASSIPTLGKQAGARMGYKEGVATWFSLAAQLHRTAANRVPTTAPRVANTLYEDTDDATISYDAEQHAGNRAKYSTTQGEGDELATIRILWDIGDRRSDVGHVVEAYDRIERSHILVYHDLRGAAAAQADGKLKNLSQVWNYYYDLRGAGVNAVKDQWRVDLGAIFEAHAVSPKPRSPIDAMLRTTDPAPRFSWDAQNNSASETFQIIIWNNDFSSRLVQTAMIVNALNYTLTAAEWGTLTGLVMPGGGPTMFRYVVAGGDRRNGADRAYAGEELTTMYWSDARSFRVIPTPGCLALLGLAGLTVVRRRR